MDDRPRMVLRDLVIKYGNSLGTDPFRTEGLLRDTCGAYPREIFVLVNAARQKIPADLLVPRHSLPFDLLQDFLTRRLRDELSLSDEASRWAVESWAGALGMTPGRAGEDPLIGQEKTVTAVSSTASADPVSESIRQRWADDLESMHIRTRLLTVHDLSHTPDPENIHLLITALNNDNWQVRECAFDALTGLGNPVIPALCGVLADTNNQIVWRATLVLGAIRARASIGALIHLLDRQGIIRECAVWSLGEIGDETASNALLKLIQTGDPGIKEEAEIALIKIGRAARGDHS
jgi:HEAT repeat protein